jgi:hypothetical protein
VIGKNKNASSIPVVPTILFSNRESKAGGIFAFEERGELKMDALSPRVHLKVKW